jgi:fibronectin-binding autotransporter adhesin
MRRHSPGKSIGSRCATAWPGMAHHRAEMAAMRRDLRTSCAADEGQVGGSVRRTMLGRASSRVALVAIAAAGLSLACGGGALVSPARAQTWNGGSGFWGTAGSWTPATVPNAVGATATFNGPPSGTDFGVDLPGGPFTIGALNLDGSTNGSGYLFQGGTLIMQVASGQALINVQTNLSTNDDFGAGALPATLQLNSITNINTESPAATIGFASQSTIAGSGGLIFSGLGTATLAGASSYTGATTIEGGTVRAGAANAFSAASATTVNAGGTLDLGGFNQTVSSLSGAGVVTNSGSPLATLTNQGASSTFSGVIQDGSSTTSLVQNSPGNTLILTGNSTYSGTTTIAAGTLQLGNGGTSGQISTDAIDNGTLAFDRSDIVTATGLISGTGSVTQIGTGTTVIAAANTYTGGTTVSGGTLGISGAGNLGASSGAMTVSGGILDLGGTTQTQNGGVTLTNGTIQNGTLSSSGTFGLQAGTVSASLAGAAGLNKTTTGTVTLSESNFYTGGTIVSAGTLDVLGSGTLGATTNSLTVSGGVLDLGGTTQTQNNVTVSGGTIQDGTLLANGTFNFQSGTVSTNLVGSAAVNKTTPGTLTLSTANELTGGTTISAGTLRLNHINAAFLIDAVGTGPIALNGNAVGATLDSSVTGTLSPALTINTITSGSSATIGATSGNTLTLASPLTYSGGAGTLRFGSATDIGTVALAPVSLLGVPTSGQISVDAGTLVLVNSNAQALLGGVSNVSVAGTLDLNSLPNPTTVQSLTLAGGMIVDGSLNVNGPISSSGGTLSGIGGTASLTTSAGTTILLGKNSYAGMTTVSGGALEVAGALGLSGAPSGPITVASGGTLNVDLSGSINIAGSSFANFGTLSNNGNITAAGLTNNGTLTTTGTINGGLTNNGAALASGTINGGIRNFSSLTLTGNLASDSVFNNSGTVRIDPSVRNVSLGSNTFTFINNGVLDLRNPNTVMTNLTIQGSYVAQDPLILLNVFEGQANHLTVTGSATGATNVEVLAFNNNPLPIFTNAIPIINVDGASSSATFTAIQSPSPTSLGNLVTYGVVEESPGQWDLVSHLNPAPIGAIAGGISSAVTSAATGFFQGTTAFLGAPATATPNQIDGGVWNRDATGMNTERSVATTSLDSGATDLKTQTRFMGYQVGSDLGMFNIQNTGWNLHGGITGGEYVASSGELNFGGSSSNYTVPFLGLYAAATGHGFFADVLLRHDFWQGNVSDSTAGLTGARMNGNGNAVTAEAGYTYRFQNGMFNGVFVTPSLGFSYTNANFQQLAVLPGSTVQPTLNVGAIVSDLGRLGVTLGDTFATQYWALTPNVNLSVWHEFAGAIPSVFNYAPSNFTDTVSQTRIGTFGQFGVGLAAQPIQNPNWTLFARADWRTGSNIYGGTLTAGFRYTF